MLFVFVALQITCYLFGAFNIFGGLINYPLGDMSNFSNLFNFNITYLALVGGGGAVAIGLAMLLLKQGVYAIYAMILWAVGIVFDVFGKFVLAIPNTIAAIIPPQTNPFAYTNGVFDPSVSPLTNPFIIVIVFLFTFGAWWYLLGIIIQRDPT
jgi:hypothetical protein